MHRSSVVARLVSAVFALVATPIAVVALSLGGAPWLMLARMALPFQLAAAPWPSLLWVALGMVLLLLVALSGLWSSAGLLAAGLWTVASLVSVMLPALSLALFRAASAVLPQQWAVEATYGTAFGTHALITLPLPVLGLVLVLSRRRPAKNLLLALGGTVLAPMVLAAGLVLMIAGIASGLVSSLQMFDLAPTALPALALLLGVLLEVLGLSMTRWAPYALLLPALAMAVATVLLLTPYPFTMIIGISGVSLGRLRVGDAIATAQGAFVTGFGPGTVALFLGATVAVAGVRGRALRTIARPVPAAAPPTAGAPSPAPEAPVDPAPAASGAEPAGVAAAPRPPAVGPLSPTRPASPAAPPAPRADPEAPPDDAPPGTAGRTP